MTNPPTIEELNTTVNGLIEALTAAVEFCDNHDGCNLPDLLSAALVDVAIDRGGAWTLTVHRPGSWEATHVEALAAGADYQLQLQREQES